MIRHTWALGTLAIILLFGGRAAAQPCVNPVFATEIINCTSYVDYLGTTTNAEAIAVADLNHDGKLDLVVSVNGEGAGNGATLEVQLGNGDGTFQAPIYLGGCCSPDLRNANWAAIGDFNGDGNLDIASSVGAGGVAIWLGDGTGNFAFKQEIPIAGTCCSGPAAGAAGDFNGDGIPDLVVINQTSNPGVAQVYFANGDGTFNATPAVVTVGTMNQNSPSSVVVGDFNQDGHLDFATVNSGCCTDSISVALGKGDGTFQTAVNYPVSNAGGNIVNGVSIVTADFNHDTYLDLATLEPGSNAIAVFLNNKDGTFATPTFYSAQGSVTDPGFPMDLAVADFNKDGNPDLAFSANWRGSTGVILGNADGSFGQPIWYVTDVVPTGVATGDFNGDGNPDVIVSTNANNSATVLLGNGNGSFKSARNYVPFIVTNSFRCSIGNGIPNPSSITFADFNGDGKPDMAVADANNCNIAIFLNNGDGTFTETANYNPHVYYSGQGYQVVAADVNDDHKMDLVVSVSDTTFSVLIGNGDGTFQTAVPYSNGTGSGSAGPMVVADINGDGKLDVISNTSNTSLNGSFYVNLGNGDGTFQSAIPTPSLCTAGGGAGALYLAVADLNSDGKPDIVGACHPGLHASTISVLLGNGDGSFGSPTPFAAGALPLWITVGDFNEDGKPDLAVVNNSSAQVSILLGNGNGTFQSPQSFSIFPNGGSGWGSPYYFAAPVSIVAADFNGDGHVDILVGDYDAYQAPYNGGSYNIGVQLFLGGGDGTFQAVQNYLAGRNASFLAVADLNGDGLPDVGVVDPLDASVNILLNSFSNPSTVLRSITVLPNPASVPAGLTQHFTATGHYLDGSTKDLTASVSWSSADTSIATINSAGLASGVAQGGPVTITAALNGINGTAPLTVTAPALQSIGVTPATPSIAAGFTQQFTATGYYSDGSNSVITSSVGWKSSDTAIATIRTTGLARGVSAGGPVTITASMNLINGTAKLTVTAPVLTSISVTPANPSVLAGNSQQFTATGNYSNGSTQDLTGSVAWSSSNTSVATISSSGLGAALSNGPTTIAASLNGIRGSTTMTVVTLQSLTIAPLAQAVFVGSNLQFTATGHYSDGSTRDLTSSAVWSSSKTSVATISSPGGLATGLGNGTTTIQAASGGLSVSTSLTVNKVFLQTIVISPSSATVAHGGSQQFTATGYYNNGAVQNLTGVVSWSIAPSKLAGISSTGLATAPAPAAGFTPPSGTATVLAKYEGVTAAGTLVVQ